MKLDVGISSLSISKLKDTHTGFVKYDIDVSLDEVENNDSGIKLKYKFILLSNPPNTKISVEGIVSISGNELDISKSLEPDQKNIPHIVNIVYQEIFPFFYVISKSMQIPCPAHKLSQISSAQKQDIKQEEPISQAPPISTPDPIYDEIEVKKIESPSEPQAQEIIQEANVSSL